MASYLLIPLPGGGSLCIIAHLQYGILAEPALYAEHGVLEGAFPPLGSHIGEKVWQLLFLVYDCICRYIYPPDQQGRVCNLLEDIEYSFCYPVQGCSVAAQVHKAVVGSGNRGAAFIV